MITKQPMRGGRLTLSAFLGASSAMLACSPADKTDRTSVGETGASGSGAQTEEPGEFVNELRYELRSRPDWVALPLNDLLAILT